MPVDHYRDKSYISDAARTLDYGRAQIVISKREMERVIITNVKSRPSCRLAT